MYYEFPAYDDTPVSSPKRRIALPRRQLSHFSNVPAETLRMILEFLAPIPDRLQCERVCRCFHSAANSPLLHTTSLSFASCNKKLSSSWIVSAMQRWTPLNAQNHSALRSLNLNSIMIGNKGLVDLATFCHALECLNMTGCSAAGDVGVNALLAVGASTLTHLNLSHCETISAPGSKLTPGSMKNLVHLDISFCRRLQVFRFLSLLHCESSALQTVDFTGAHCPIDSRVFAVLGGFPQLRSLQLRGCTISPARNEHGFIVSLDDLLLAATNLELLDIAGVKPASAAVAALSAPSTSLRILNANRSSVRNISSEFPNLIELHVAWLTIPDAQLLQIASKSTSLVLLDASGTQISVESKQALEQRNLQLTMFLSSCRGLPRDQRTGASGSLKDTEEDQ
jgi:hypothetical protein